MQKVPKQTRKRLRKETERIKHKSKILRNLGKEYVTCEKKNHAKKMVRPPCADKCIYKCGKKITAEQRLSIFKDY